MVFMINGFKNEWRVFSNFWSVTIQYEGIKYLTVEHAYQATKTLDIELRKVVANASTPAIAKRLGRSLKLREDWEDIKIRIMTDLVRLKFQNEHLRKMLIKTHPAELIEENNWKDRFWGVYKGVGENNLGKILMQVRTEVIREEYDRMMREVNGIRPYNNYPYSI